MGQDGRAQGRLAASTPAHWPGETNPEAPAPTEGQDAGGHPTKESVLDQGGEGLWGG